MIEILLVLGLMTIFSTLVLVGVNPIEMEARARDTQRIADLGVLSTAVETYIADNGAPPDLANTLRRSDQAQAGSVPQRSDGTGWLQVNLGKYLPKLLTDPLNRIDNGKSFFYRYKHNGKRYKFDALLEYYTGYAISDGGTDQARYEIGSGVATITF